MGEDHGLVSLQRLNGNRTKRVGGWKLFLNRKNYTSPTSPIKNKRPLSFETSWWPWSTTTFHTKYCKINSCRSQGVSIVNWVGGKAIWSLFSPAMYCLVNKMIDLFFQSVAHAYSEKDNPSSPKRSRIYDLPFPGCSTTELQETCRS